MQWGCAGGNAEIILPCSTVPHAPCSLQVTPTPLAASLVNVVPSRSAKCTKNRDTVCSKAWEYLQLMTEARKTPNIDVSCSHSPLGFMLVTSCSCAPRCTPWLCEVTLKIGMRYVHTRKTWYSVDFLLWFVHIRWQAPRDLKDDGLNNRSNSIWELLSWIQGSGMRR